MSHNQRHTDHRIKGQWLPTTRKEMEHLGWEQADVILFTGDAYIDHPSMGTAVIGRVLEAHGYKVANAPCNHSIFGFQIPIPFRHIKFKCLCKFLRNTRFFCYEKFFRNKKKFSLEMLDWCN